MKTVQIKLRTSKESEPPKQSPIPTASKMVQSRGKSVLEQKLGHLLDAESLHTLEIAIDEEVKMQLGDCPDGGQLYDQILCKVCLHLNPNSSVKNTYLLDQVISGNIDIKDVPAMSPIDMHPHAWAKQSTAMKLETEQVAGGVKTAVTGIIKCKKCGGKTSYNEVQNRSCDEAATVTVHCPTCNTKWTQ